MRGFRCFLLVMAFAACGVKAQSISDAELVQQFFPDRLTTESASIEGSGGPSPTRIYAFKAADLDGSGQANYIVAAYTNGFSAAVRVLRRTSNGATLAADPQLSMHGVQPALELRDLDGDRKPEIIAAFSSPTGGTAKWIFKWTGSNLMFLGPSIIVRGKEQTTLGDAVFVDIDGDGIPEILDPPKTTSIADDGTIVIPDVSKVYALRNGKFVKIADVNFFAIFPRGSSGPTVQHEEFTISHTDRAYEIHIDNGSRQNKTAVDSAVVKLNGATIASQQQFNENTTQIVVRPVTLLANNSLDVEVFGNPSSQLTIIVQPVSQ